MVKKSVAVVFGGRSNEHEISKISAVNVMGALPTDKYYILPIYITVDGRWYLYDGVIENLKDIQWEKLGTPVIISPDTKHKGLLRIVGNKIKNIPIDVVFPVIHGKNGEDGSIQGLCELAGIPYVGSGVTSSGICMDKAYTNLVAKTLGINQAASLVVRSGDLADIEAVCKDIRYKIGYPCFVKPANSGSSIGVSKAGDKKQLKEALLTAVTVDSKIVVEKYIDGRELECAILGNNNPVASPVGEVVSAVDFYDFDAKYNSTDSKTIVPADIPEEISQEIQSMALKIYSALDCSGMSRVDFFLQKGTNKIFFNEINTIPGFTAISLYPMLWGEVGMSQPELVDKLIQLALEKHASLE